MTLKKLFLLTFFFKMFLFYHVNLFSNESKTIAEKNNLNHFLDDYYFPNGISNIVAEYLKGDLNFKYFTTIWCYYSKSSGFSRSGTVWFNFCELNDGNLAIGIYCGSCFRVEIFDIKTLKCRHTVTISEKSWFAASYLYQLKDDRFVAMDRSGNLVILNLYQNHCYFDTQLFFVKSFDPTMWQSNDNKLLIIDGHEDNDILYIIDVMNNYNIETIYKNSDLGRKLLLLKIKNKKLKINEIENGYQLFLDDKIVAYINERKYEQPAFCILKDGRVVMGSTDGFVEIWRSHFYELMELHKPEEPSSCCVIS